MANPESRAALCQMAGFRWVTLEGAAVISDDQKRVTEGVWRYTRRYRAAPPNPPGRVVIEITVDRVMTLNT